MHPGIKLALASALALLALPGRAAFAAPADQKDLKEVLHQLDVAAANFHSTSADVEFDDITTDPVYDKDVFTGIVYYDRKATAFRMGVHFSQHNGRPSTKAYTFVGGILKLRDSDKSPVTSYPQAGKWESYIMLGFGASGKDLESKWEIKDLGTEQLSDGKATIKTEKLELVAKDPDVRKNLAKVTIWVDPDRALSLKQVFVLNPASSKICLYSNFKVNDSLPKNAFTLDPAR